MDQARQTIREALATSSSPAVLCSFGKDSLLLLALVREVRPDTPVLWFRSTAVNSTFARAVIRRWRLTVYGYGPADSYLLTRDGQTTLVQEYSFGEQRVPLLTDLAPGTTCSLTFAPQRTATMFLPFDVLFTGYKDCDTHWLKGGAELFKEGTHFGRAKVVTPIRHMSDDQVRGALYDLNIPYTEADDRLPLCTACMTQTTDEVWCPARGHYIPLEQWDREAALNGFNQRFQLGEHDAERN